MDQIRNLVEPCIDAVESRINPSLATTLILAKLRNSGAISGEQMRDLFEMRRVLAP